MSNIMKLPATIINITKNHVVAKLDDQRIIKLPRRDFPRTLNVNDRVVLVLEIQVTSVIVVNGEEVASNVLEIRWNGTLLIFTSTSDSGYITTKESGSSCLHVYFNKGVNPSTYLGVVTAEWDPSHSFACMSFKPNTNSNIAFRINDIGFENMQQLPFGQVEFFIVSDGPKVYSVNIS